MLPKNSANLILALFLAQEAALAVLLFAWGYPGIAIFLSVVVVAIIAYVIASFVAMISGAPFVPLETDRVTTMLKLSGLKPGERLVDLGSGDGRIVIAAARAGAYAEGWEINPFLWAYSSLMIRVFGLRDRAKVHLQSYWPVSFAEADVVTLFLLTPYMARMQDKLQKELRPGARVVSFVFTFPEWKHEAMSEGTYLYKKA